MIPRLQYRLRLGVIQSHGRLPITSCLLSAANLITSHQPSPDKQARITTSAARLGPITSRNTESRLNWSKTAHSHNPLSRFDLPMGSEKDIGSGQARGHVGHSHGHGHHHHHDNSFLTSKNRDDPGVRITKIGLYVNVGMAIGKGVGGYVFHSQAYVHPVSVQPRSLPSAHPSRTR